MNKFQLMVTTAAALAMAGPAAASTDWYVADHRDKACLLVRDNFLGASTPEQVRDMLARNGSYYTLQRPTSGVVFLSKMTADNVIIFFNDRHRCELAVIKN